MLNPFNIVRSPGSPKPSYLKPQVRVNGQVQDAPSGWKLDTCYLPTAATGTPQLSITSTALSIVGSNTVMLPTPVAGTPPVIDNSASIPASVFGTDTHLLATPAGWYAFPGLPNIVFPGYAV